MNIKKNMSHRNPGLAGRGLSPQPYFPRNSSSDSRRNKKNAATSASLIHSVPSYSQPPQEKSTPIDFPLEHSMSLEDGLAVIGQAASTSASLPLAMTHNRSNTTQQSSSSPKPAITPPRSSKKRARALFIAPDPHHMSFDSTASGEDDAHDDYVGTTNSPSSGRDGEPLAHPDAANVRHDTAHLSSLIASLILINALAVMAGMDAKHECLLHDINALLAMRKSSRSNKNDENLDQEEEDDIEMDEEIFYYNAAGAEAKKDQSYVSFEEAYDEVYLKEAENGCIRLFRRVMLPVMLVTTLAGILGLCLLRYTSGNAIPPTEAFAKSWRLLCVVTIILIAQTYNITCIMLSPRRSENVSSENPFHTLAAVDLLGHVSDNANLYYLTWLSIGLASALFYQTTTATMRAYRAVQIYKRNSALLPATSWYIISETAEESRHAWYQSVYRLRTRTGIWTAALLTCLVITASSQFIWREVLWPYVYYENNENEGGANNINSNPMQSLRGLHFSVCQTVFINSGQSISVAMCRRTAIAWLTGILAMILCAIAIGMHWVARTSTKLPHTPTHQQSDEILNPNVFRQMLERHRVPLGTELILSIVVSLILGYNAVFVTGLHGPAANVGNLYYASWIAFFLLIRICLGCLEEWYQVDDREKPQLAVTPNDVDHKQPGVTSTTRYLAPALFQDNDEDTADLEDERSAVPTSPKQNRSEETDGTGSTTLVDQTEKDRAKRLRTYFCLSIFSTICAVSAHDAASQEETPLNGVQRYILLAPAIVANISLVLFLLCLSRRTYLIASHLLVGGVLAVVSFGLWLADLVLTMHSEESWAVNRIGEIKMANLYYFSWASILTAGFQLSTYVKAVFGINKHDTMAIVWIGICKVCFVIFGAGMHIWLNVSNNCDIAQLTGAVTFCSRTVLAIIVSLTGMFVGSLVVSIRFFQAISKSCYSHRLQAHIEIILSLFLLLLFAAAVALITGIGGPGQSVGDLYYSTWLAFATSLGIFLHCYDQITRAEDEVKPQFDQKSNGALV